MYSRLNEGPSALSGTGSADPGHVTIHVPNEFSEFILNMFGLD
jgi:hypothetical protein